MRTQAPGSHLKAVRGGEPSPELDGQGEGHIPPQHHHN